MSAMYSATMGESSMMRTLIICFLEPKKILLSRPGDEANPEIISLAPYAKALTCMDGKATAYVCQNYQCSLPVTEADKLADLLTAKAGYARNPSYLVPLQNEFRMSN